MKKIRLYRFPVLTALCIAALVTVSCDFPDSFPDPDSPGNPEKMPETIPEGEGLLLVTLPGSGVSEPGRSILPDSLLSMLEYTLMFTKGTDEKTVPKVTGGTHTISLAAGDWTVTAEASDSSDSLVPIGTGSTTVTVTAGQRVYAVIVMEPAGTYANTLGLSTADTTLWNVTGQLNWPTFLPGKPLPEPGTLASEPDGPSPWYWSKTINILSNGISGSGVSSAYVPALWFE
jgi:hypothetical protein